METTVAELSQAPAGNLARAPVWKVALDLAPMLLAHAGTLAIFWLAVPWQLWLALPAAIYARGLLITAGYHRYFAHRSFKTGRVGQFVLAVLCCVNLQQGPLWWAGYHRHHHRHSDAKGDPHSPHQGGFWWSYCGWLFVPLAPPWNDVPDLRKYLELVWLERVWQVPGLLFACLCFWLGGWPAVCVVFCLSAVVTFHLTFVVNSFGHLVGSRRYATKDHSRNSFVLALLTQGDGWHNNHHHYPAAAQAGFFWWEADGAFRVIRLLEWVGLVWDVRRVPPHRLAPTEGPRTIPTTCEGEDRHVRLDSNAR